jgi:hypothetical protein
MPVSRRSPGGMSREARNAGLVRLGGWPGLMFSGRLPGSPGGEAWCGLPVTEASFHLAACRRSVWCRGLHPKGRALSPRARRSAFHPDRGPRAARFSCRYQRKGGELRGAAARGGGRGARAGLAAGRRDRRREGVGVVCTRVPGDGPDRQLRAGGVKEAHGAFGATTTA